MPNKFNRLLGCFYLYKKLKYSCLWENYFFSCCLLSGRIQRFMSFTSLRYIRIFMLKLTS